MGFGDLFKEQKYAPQSNASSGDFTPINPNGFGFAKFGKPKPIEQPPIAYSTQTYNDPGASYQKAALDLAPPNFRMLEDRSLTQPMPQQQPGGFFTGLFQKAGETIGVPQAASFLHNKVLDSFPNAYDELGKYNNQELSAMSGGLLNQSQIDQIKSGPQGSTQRTTPQDFVTPLDNSFGTKAGEFVGNVLPYLGAGAVARTVEGGVARLAPKLGQSLGGRMLQRGIGEAVAFGGLSAGFEGGKAALDPQGFDLGQSAQKVGLDAAIGGAFGAASPVIGQWARGMIERFGKGAKQEFIPSTLPERLALPQPNNPISGLLERPRIAGLLPEPPKPDFIAGFGQQATPRRFTPKAPESNLNFQRPETLSQYRAVNPAERQLQELFNVAGQKGLSVGREYEDLQNLLGQLSNRSGMSLDDLINESTKQISIVERAIGKKVPMDPKSFLELATEVADRNRLAQAAGVMDRPTIGRGPTQPVPFVAQVPKPLPELPRTNVNPLEPPTLGRVKPLKKGPALNADPMAEVAATAEPLTNPLNPSNAIDATKFKDYSGFKYNSTDLYRNLRDVSGDQFPTLQKTILEPFDKAKADFTTMQQDYLKRLKADVVDGLGIKKGSKLSSLVQQYGEKKLTLDELKKQAPNDWEKVVKADGWFRKNYDELIDKVNATRQELYPGNAEKIVPKREDYYRHFQEFNGLTGLKNLFDTPSAIDPSLVGVSEFTKPNSKFAGFMQKRGLGPYKNDAVGGFLNYIQPAAYATHIDPQIGAFKDLAKTVADQTADTKNANNFINFVDKFAQDLGGKTNAADRYVQDNIPGGRKTMAIIQWINNRVKANVILGNVGSTLAQVANIPNGVAFAKQHAIPGAGRTLVGLLKPSEAMSQSGFLKERFIGKAYRQFDTKLLEQPKVFAEWMMETADRVGTGFVWNSAYSKGLAQKAADPIKYADNETRRLIAGRGVGEVPLMQKSKLFQLALPFQLEVANQWRVMKDFVSAKDFAGLAMLFVASNLLNEGMKQVRGSKVVFDPIQAIKDAMQEDLTPLQRAGRIGGEILSNLPGGQTLAAMYPEYGTTAFGQKLPTRKNLFGDNDPTRFGSGIVAMNGLQDPLYKLLLPFGGGQLKKSLQGTSAVKNEGDYLKNYATDFLKAGQIPNNQLRYPIDTSDPLKSAQSLLFGPNATSEGQTYYKNNRRPLGEEDTLKYQKTSDKQRFYNEIMQKRATDNAESKMSDIAKDKSLTREQKLQEIAKIKQKLQEQTK